MAHRIPASGSSPSLQRIGRGWIPVVGVLAVAAAAAILTGGGRAGDTLPAPSQPGLAADPVGSAPRLPSGSAAAAVSPAPIPPRPSAAGSPNSSGAAGPPPVAVARGPFSGYLMIADRQNGRIIMVDASHRIRWRFPIRGSLPRGQRFSADDAFLSPDGRSIMANEESHQVVVRIDIRTRRVVWEYGHYDSLGSGPGFLNTPDDAYPLANGNVIIADIRNCRVQEISRAKRVVRQWGRTGICRDHPPATYGDPNGDTPLSDGGLLITEIDGSRVVRLDRAGHVLFDIHVPVAYPSDAQLDATGHVLVVDYSNPGAVLMVNRRGTVVWRYGPLTGRGRLDHPSLAIELPNGLIAVNDDFRHRVIVIDPRSRRIVWQYGHTDIHGSTWGYLFTPDGIDPIPATVAATL